jgi:hypothetical protein
VDTNAGRACPASDGIQVRLATLAAAHAGLPPPDGAGRAVAINRPSAAAD